MPTYRVLSEPVLAVEDARRELEELPAPPSLSGHQRGLEGRRRLAGEGATLLLRPGTRHSQALTFGGGGRREGPSPCGSAACQVPVTAGHGLVVVHALGAARPDHRGLSVGDIWRTGTPTESKRSLQAWEASVARPRPPG
ncbi:hypothetical protein NDU88_002029 [Pleurodeles waltl]|uniref:Uncharacterized protein n=1 Tax=Pleurodeles waltl TaxID=8319 RepID=A0AAV7SCK7_PLEWA|nr:hypothetical protein NDU88_002029 [Pleurodeles waltl]